MLKAVSLILLFSGAAFACSLIPGAEDPTGSNMLLGFLFFLAALASLGGQVFLYRFRKGANAALLWTTVGLAAIGFPIAGFFALLNGGTACGEGVPVIGFSVMLFFVAALILQAWLVWPPNS